MQISQFLDRKLDRRFATYDPDGDGFIERCDFEKAAASMAAEFGLGLHDGAGARLAGSCLGLWEMLAGAAHADEDGQISRARYKAAFAAGVWKPPSPSTPATGRFSTPSWTSPIWTATGA